MALEMIYETEVLGRSVSAANRRTDLAQMVRQARQAQLPQFGVCRDVKSADLLGFR